MTKPRKFCTVSVDNFRGPFLWITFLFLSRKGFSRLFDRPHRKEKKRGEDRVSHGGSASGTPITAMRTRLEKAACSVSVMGKRRSVSVIGIPPRRSRGA